MSVVVYRCVRGRGSVSVSLLSGDFNHFFLYCRHKTQIWCDEVSGAADQLVTQSLTVSSLTVKTLLEECLTGFGPMRFRCGRSSPQNWKTADQ